MRDRGFEECSYFACTIAQRLNSAPDRLKRVRPDRFDFIQTLALAFLDLAIQAQFPRGGIFRISLREEYFATGGI